MQKQNKTKKKRKTFRTLIEILDNFTPFPKRSLPGLETLGMWAGGKDTWNPLLHLKFIKTAPTSGF